MMILIPTLARGPMKQKTWDNLPPRLREVTQFVVAKKEADAFDSAGLPAVVCPVQGVKGLGAVRDWCVKYAAIRAETKLALLDDDLVTWALRGSTPTGDGYLKCGPKEVGKAFTRMDRHLDRYAHGAIGHRLFAQDREELSYNGRALRALFYRVDILVKENLMFDVRTMSDFDMTIKLLRAGYSNVIDSYVVQDHNGSGTPGGCSVYRDAAELQKAAKEIHKRYPEYTKLVTRSGGTWGFDRQDVRVAWARIAKENKAGRIG